MEVRKIQRCVWLLVLGLLLEGSISVRAGEMRALSNGVVVARILGPNQPAFGKSGAFPVALKIVAVHGDFATELRGEVITVPTQGFNQAMLGKTLPLTLSCHAKGTNEVAYSLMCTHVGAAYWHACAVEKQQPVELKPTVTEVAPRKRLW